MGGKITFGKTVILGDSYSTYDGIIPKGYNPYYGTEEWRNGVTASVQMWWVPLLKNEGDVLLFNSSYSGSAIAEITYNGAHNHTTAFATRYLKDLDPFDFDTVFIFGGTNDSWAGSPPGEIKTDGAYTQADMDCTVTGFCRLLSLIRAGHPRARIVNLVNTDIKPEIGDGMEIACKHFGADCICLQNISKVAGHPDVLGMQQIAEQVLAHFHCI